MTLLFSTVWLVMADNVILVAQDDSSGQLYRKREDCLMCLNFQASESFDMDVREDGWGQ